MEEGERTCKMGKKMGEENVRQGVGKIKERSSGKLRKNETVNVLPRLAGC